MNFSVETLPKRIHLQKSVYLLSKLKFPGLEEYSRTYRLYIYGPYSSKVAKDAFELSEMNQFKKSKFNQDETRIFKDFTTIIDSVQLPGRSLTLKYEMLADVLFYKLNRSVSYSTSEAIFKKLVENHEYLDDRELFDIAETALRDVSLVR